MKKSHNYFAVVTDEFGGTYGVITITDLLEKLVGDLYQEDDEFKRLPSGEVIIMGKTDLDKFEKKYNLKLSSDSATVGGWVTEQLGRLPQNGDSFEYESLSITVSKTDNKKDIIYINRFPRIMEEGVLVMKIVGTVKEVREQVKSRKKQGTKRRFRCQRMGYAS